MAQLRRIAGLHWIARLHWTTRLHRIAGALILVIAATGSASGDASGQTPGPALGAASDPEKGQAHAPFELTRSLNAIHDQIALGSEAALAAQHGLLLRVGRQMAAADRAAWREPVNARAAIEYVLSGGEPDLLRTLLTDELLPPGEIKLARAALSYATGRLAEAWSRFEAVDTHALAPSLGAHVALAQASLIMASAPEQARGYLETARLLAPGTLIEEAALRRQLSVESRLSRPDRFISLARYYFRRFPHSIYGENLLHRLPDLWTDLGLPSDGESFARLEQMLAGLEDRARRGVYLALARQHVLVGDREFVRFAAARAAELSADGSAEALRARLYAASVNIAGADWAEGGRALRAIDPALLPALDADLHMAALAIASEVQGLPERIDMTPSVVIPVPAVVARAREAIIAADTLLRSAP